MKKTFTFIFSLFLLANIQGSSIIKIMPLGNSITNGYVVPGGYRAQFWRDLEAAGLNCGVDIVGTLHDNPTPDLGDIDHEGHGGNLIDQIASNINTWMDATQPDIIMLEIGTNDIAFNIDLPNAPTRLGLLIDKICAKLPTNGKLYVATIIPFGGAEANQNANNYNAALSAIIEARQSAGKPVFLVDLNKVISLSDLSLDNVHPNQNGYNKMGDFWFNVIKNDITTVCGDIVPVIRVAFTTPIATINPGSTQQLTAFVSPINAYNKNVNWSSSNTDIATVDLNGLVTGVSAGTATINVSTQDGGKVSSCLVTVPTPILPVTGVSMIPTSVNLNVGGTWQLIASVVPANSIKTVTWSSSNSSIATVNSTGFVTGIAAGNATITVTTQDGNFTATCQITINSSSTDASSKAIIIKAEFPSATDGLPIILNGTSPDVTNLPSYLWVEAAGWNAYSHPCVGQNWNSLAKNSVSLGGSKVLGISIKSNGTYLKPQQLHISADVKIQCDVYKAKVIQGKALVGFYSELPALNSGTPFAKFTGFELKGDGSLTLIENGVAGSTIAETNLPGDSIIVNQLYTLSYDINTTNGGMSNVTLQGSSSNYNFTSTAFTDLATAFTGFGAGGDDNFIGIDNFIISDNTSLTQTQNIKDNQLFVYPNPANRRVYFSENVSEVDVFSLQGQQIISARNISSLEVNSLSQGLYIVRMTDTSRNQKSAKLEIR